MGTKVSHVEAIKLTKCCPDGCQATDILYGLRKLVRKRIKMKKVRNPSIYLLSGKPVLLASTVCDHRDHFKVAIGLMNQKLKNEKYLISDPCNFFRYWQSKTSVIKDAGSEMYIFE
jgi:hypothetical protein